MPLGTPVSSAPPVDPARYVFRRFFGLVALPYSNGKVFRLLFLSLVSSFVLAFLLHPVAAEKKVSVSQVVFDSPIEDVQWFGPHHRTVLARTSGGRLYRSVNSGRSWVEITDKLQSNGRNIVVHSLITHSAEKNMVVVVGKKRAHFVSDDQGASFRRMAHDRTIHNLLFHPSRPRWALMSSWSDACANVNYGSGEKCRHDLYVTKDLGRTFSLAASYIVQYSWGDKKLGTEDIIYMTHYKSKRGHQSRAGGWAKVVDFSVSSDQGLSWKVVVPQGNKFLISNGYIFVAKLVDPERQMVNLMVSTNGGSSFAAAKLPAELQERSYTILDTSEGAVILHVNHGHVIEGGTSTGNVYISDEKGLRFALSLPRNIRADSGECELDKVSSLEGVYIANYKETANANSETSVEEAKASAVEAEESAARENQDTEIDRKRRKTKRGKSEVAVRTVISFDKGGVWSFLKPPKVDSRGRKVDCDGQCWLHLHGLTNFHHFAPFYSVENAVGIIMGTGNVGSSLRYEDDEVNTYLSRDGGQSWVEAHKGAYIYEFGDHGGLIVMADDVKQTNQVVFSWNEGQSWYDFDLGDSPVEVDNIVIEPNSSSVEFLLYGVRGGSGVLYHLDFETLGQPPCKGQWAADSVSSDYESWTPTDGRTGESCILGRQITYTRRKQTSECFNGLDFDRPIEKKNCSCTERDYECEFGFTRSIGSLDCRPEDPTLTAEGCTSSGMFLADAYRRIPGDTCIGGWKPEKVPVLCPAKSPFSGGAKIVLFSVLGLAGILGLLTIANRHPRLKGFMENHGLDGFSSAKYAVLGASRFLTDTSLFGPGEEHGGREGKSHRSPLPHLPEAGDDEEKQGRIYEFDQGVGYNPEDQDDDPGFIETEMRTDLGEDAPPLLDFNANHSRLSSGSERARGVHAATESVPRLAPPPKQGEGSRNRKLGEEFELL